MNVLIVRTSAMGDVVHCLPVLRGLRRALPEARIGWVVEEVFAPLLEGHPDLDAVFPVRLRPWRKGLFSRPVRREMKAALRAIRGFKPDVALDLMGNHKSGFVAWLSGARRIVGARRRDRREPASAIWINEPVALRAAHVVDRALEIGAALGVEASPADFGGELLLPEVPKETAAFLAERRRPYVLIQAGAGWGSKTWPPAFWGEVAERLTAEALVEVWVPVAPGEEHLARSVAASSRGTARTVDASPFAALAALVRGSALLLGGDTGPLHLAHALGTPVVAVMGPTDPRRHGPYGAPGRALTHRLPCSFCYKRFPEARACLLGVAPAEVAARGLELLA